MKWDNEIIDIQLKFHMLSSNLKLIDDIKCTQQLFQRTGTLVPNSRDDVSRTLVFIGDKPGFYKVMVNTIDDTMTPQELITPHEYNLEIG